MRKLISRVLLLAVFTLTSCSTIHYRFENDPNGVDETKWQNFALFELVNYTGDVQTRKHCRDGVHSITTKRTFIQGLIAGFPWVGWLAWSPRHVKMECGEKLAVNGSGSNNSNVNNNKNANNNNQTININIAPDMMKKKKRRKKRKRKIEDDE